LISQSRGLGDVYKRQVRGAGFATGTKTPMFHTIFLPLFTHVYVLPALTLLIPALAQELPAFTAPKELFGIKTRRSEKAVTIRRDFFISS
jgi:hypothetical protein